MGRGIGAFGWDGNSDLGDALRKVVTEEPGLGLMVVFDGADVSGVLETAREVMAQPGAGLRELGVVVRGDGICRIVRVLRRSDAGSGVLGELAPRAGAETVERVLHRVTVSMPAQVPETPTARLLLIGPEAGGPREVGVLGGRAAGLSPGTWVVLSRQNAPDRGRLGRAPGAVEVFALGRISRQPSPRARLLTYDRLSVRNRPVRVHLLDARKGQLNGTVSLSAAAAAFGVALENIDRVAPSMAAGDILAQLPDLPVGFAESVAATVNAGKNLLLVGAPGSGKTTMAIGLARAFFEAGFVDESPRVVSGDSPESWKPSRTGEEWRDNSFGEGRRSRQTPYMSASGLLIVDDLEADALPVLVRELAERARTSDSSGEKPRAVATALPRAALDERAMPRYPSRHLVVMRIPPPGLAALVAVVERSGVLTEPTRTKLAAAVREAAAWLTSGVVSDVVRYLEELQVAGQRTDTAGMIEEAFELFARAFAKEEA
ncbi:ATP-binding protein [Streptomyces zaehneri]|uniref:ATP-binding protein n=1 Tax=Streptomyces zaehneri TaxID=3051180 RepID=UPI0028D21A59|nr:ATP-binding protein [Streptomyces sp. DSM 40713]